MASISIELETNTESGTHNVVSHEEWLAARRAFLAKEKEFTRQRDELSRQRQQLPWETVDKLYRFDSTRGKVTLPDLFDGRSQLAVYHFMLGPGWEAGCPSCSFVADGFDGVKLHLANRDTTLVVVSRAPLAEIEAFKKRMGWQFEWVSSFGSDFNYDYYVSFKPEDKVDGKVDYNYEIAAFPQDEAPGMSVFAKGKDGEVFHTYSAYARGLDILLNTYNILDIVPKGRDENGPGFTMAWVRHHDRYEQSYFGAGANEEAGKSAKRSCCGAGGE